MHLSLDSFGYSVVGEKMWENYGFYYSCVVFVSMNLFLLGYDTCNYMYLWVYIWLLSSEWLVADNMWGKCLFLSFVLIIFLVTSFISMNLFIVNFYIHIYNYIHLWVLQGFFWALFGC
jgi:hypothetical protein